nr:hypothetical protein [Acinetobacter tandoii]
MRSNIDHNAIINQGKSIALAIQVDNWLKAKGKSEPTQIPFGHSGLSHKPKSTEYKTGQQSMRESMAHAVSAKRPVLPSLDKPLTAEQQRHKFNFEAKNKAIAADENTFQGKCDLHGLTDFKVYKSGKCHCIKCRERTKQLRKEA